MRATEVPNVLITKYIKKQKQARLFVHLKLFISIEVLLLFLFFKD